MDCQVPQICGSVYDELLKVLMTQQHNKWLDNNSNAERWYGNEKPYSTKNAEFWFSIGQQKPRGNFAALIMILFV